MIATDVDQQGLSSLPSPIQSHRLDSTDGQAVATFARQAGRFDAAVHCVGFVHQGTILECNETDWARSFAINVDSFYHLMRAVLPSMVEAREGSVVCIASIASSLRGLPSRAAYGSTKAAMIGLVKSVAADFAAARVRANAVCPGTIMTPSLLARAADFGRDVGGAEEAMRRFVARQPMGRLGMPEEIAALCVYLASDESRFVTGQAYAIDGGATI